jgi:lipoic acid synthetase
MRIPDWIRSKHMHSELRPTKLLMRAHGLSTVCEEARCPNAVRCFSKRTAAFMILGSRCTRDCGFCSVESGVPLAPDPDEPRRVALAAAELGMRYVVVTSVTRDDLDDGGASLFAASISALKKELPGVRVEVLTPDFNGDTDALNTVLEAGPDVFNHNMETVPGLYPEVRPQADYDRSVRVIRHASAFAPDVVTKSGFMLGLGESYNEVLDVLTDLRDAGCDYLTVGQYLRPSRKNLPVVEYASPETFRRIRNIALGMGFRHVAADPNVRSSMNAEEMYDFGNGVGNV